MGVGIQRHARVALPPGKTRYSLHKRLGGPQSRVGRVRKISPSLGFVQPVAYTYLITTSYTYTLKVQIQ
jgi:hypothetical protein